MDKQTTNPLIAGLSLPLVTIVVGPGHIAPVCRNPEKTSSHSRAQCTVQALQEEEAKDDEEEDDVDDLSIRHISSLSRENS